jgi:putative transposase
MDERLKFIAHLLDGEKMAGLCREFGISRKTGYKILTRYNEIGLEGLIHGSRRPYRNANQPPVQMQIVRLKKDKPSWGAPKIREKLARLYPDVHTLAIRTVHAGPPHGERAQHRGSAPEIQSISIVIAMR